MISAAFGGDRSAVAARRRFQFGLHQLPGLSSSRRSTSRRSWNAATDGRWPIDTRSCPAGAPSACVKLGLGLGSRLRWPRPGTASRASSQRAGDGDALLLAAGEQLRPVLVLVEPRGELRPGPAASSARDVLALSSRRMRIGHDVRSVPIGM